MLAHLVAHSVLVINIAVLHGSPASSQPLTCVTMLPHIIASRLTPAHDNHVEIETGCSMCPAMHKHRIAAQLEQNVPLEFVLVLLSMCLARHNAIPSCFWPDLADCLIRLHVRLPGQYL